MKKTIACLSTFAGLAAIVWAQAGQPAKDQAALAGLDKLKQLAGDWVMVKSDGKTGEEVAVSYCVIAAGSAVLERLFPGSDHEMVTVYHQDGKDLVLTHYCTQGNQPHMRAEPREGGPEKIVFKFVKATNLKNEGDAHMHDGSITFLDRDHIKCEWTMYRNGKLARVSVFDLARKKG